MLKAPACPRLRREASRRQGYWVIRKFGLGDWEIWGFGEKLIFSSQYPDIQITRS